jgi:hypothetical protein
MTDDPYEEESEGVIPLIEDKLLITNKEDLKDRVAVV